MPEVDEGLAAGIRLLAARRVALGYSQRELADRVGVDDVLIAKWEAGHRRPSSFFRDCWAEALGCRWVVRWVVPARASVAVGQPCLPGLEEEPLGLRLPRLRREAEAVRVARRSAVSSRGTVDGRDFGIRAHSANGAVRGVAGAVAAH